LYIKKISFQKIGRIILLTLLVSYFLLNYDCAHNVPPSGGPEDKIPPEIIYHFPAADSVGIRHLEFIEVEFSEPIRRTTLPNNFWIIPELVGEMQVKWKGSRKVRFYLPDSLAADQTYVFTLSTGITDMHNNRLVRPFQIAFSSGEQLDRGSIQGQVYTEKISRDVYINAYILDENEESDSLLRKKPRYYTQIDGSGSYKLNYLSLNKFRVIALQDQDYDERYTLGSDLIGIPFTDVRLDSLDPDFFQLNFYLIKEDTILPAISRIDTASGQEIIIEFKEPVLLEQHFSVQVEDTVHNIHYPVLGTSLDSDNHAWLHLFFSELPPQTELAVRLSGVKDYSGNTIISDTLDFSFTSASQPDTVTPRLLKVEPSQGSSNVLFNDSIRLSFNVPVDSSLYQQYFTLETKEGKVVSGHYDFSNLRRPVYIPAGLLSSATTYNLTLQLDSLADIWKRSFPDTVISMEFTTMELSDLGEISGYVRAPTLNWYQAIVEADALKGRAHYRALAKKDIVYQMDYLPDGLFMTKAIMDLNENGSWDKGSTIRWQYSEPFFLKPDTVKVRKRWTTQGIDFIFNFREKP